MYLFIPSQHSKAFTMSFTYSIEERQQRQQQQQPNRKTARVRRKVGHQSLGSVVQSDVSLMISLRVISLTVLADSVYNILIFFAEKM